MKYLLYPQDSLPWGFSFRRTAVIQKYLLKKYRELHPEHQEIIGIIAMVALAFILSGLLAFLA